MKNFVFTARNQLGKVVKGSEEAENVDSLANRLQLRGLVVTSIKLEPQTGASAQAQAKARKVRRFSHYGIKEDDLFVFSRQLATAIGSGVPLLRSMEIILSQVGSKKFYEVVNNIARDIESGFSFRDALAKHPRVFSNIWVNIAETGEASGNLPLVLERLAQYLESRASFKRKIISALVYPAILMLVALIAIFVFLLVIIPRFEEIFKSFGAALPLLTQILISISNNLRKNIILIFLGFGGSIFLLKRYAATKRGKRLLDNLVLKAPVLNEFFRLIEVEKFCASMTTLLEAGVPILYALEIAERSSSNTYVQAIISNVKDSVRQGKTLAGPLGESEFFPVMVTQMVSIGEEIGELDKMFKKIAVFYAEVLETQITRFTSMFEPITIVFMGLIIGTMVVAMFLPIFQMANIAGAGH